MAFPPFWGRFQMAIPQSLKLMLTMHPQILLPAMTAVKPNSSTFRILKFIRYDLIEHIFKISIQPIFDE
jgi:hypothetical protein